MKSAGYAPVMGFSIRRMQRGRCQRVIALLACLLFVTSTITAMPMPMSVMLSAHGEVKAAHHDSCEQTRHQSHAHGHASLQAPCCNGADGADCHCAAMSAGLLPIIAATSLAPVQRLRFDRLPHVAAPAPARAAPLRPPQA